MITCSFYVLRHTSIQKKAINVKAEIFVYILQAEGLNIVETKFTTLTHQLARDQVALHLLLGIHVWFKHLWPNYSSVRACHCTAFSRLL